MESYYLKGNMCCIYCLKPKSHVVPLWHQAYSLLEKANCLGTLRDIEDLSRS